MSASLFVFDLYYTYKNDFILKVWRHLLKTVHWLWLFQALPRGELCTVSTSPERPNLVFSAGCVIGAGDVLVKVKNSIAL
jgi:hypothetical protein